MKYIVLEKTINKLLENIHFSNNKGMIVASPSNDPPYKFHWVRDSSLVMRVIIDLYKRTNKDKYLILIFNYIEAEGKIQKIKTLTGLGEPKFNIDCTAYNEPWGRPQNDGPALRLINMIKIYKIFNKSYNSIANKIVLPIIFNDIKYLIDNYNKTCYDLWEEIIGWHFYTRLVQLKSIKDFINFKNNFLNNNNCPETLIYVDVIYKKLLNDIKDHINFNNIISSFDKDGNIKRYNDASVLLAFCHINFDEEILNEIPLEYTINTCNELLEYFNNKYQKRYNLIGRYKKDKYYNGHSWIICSLALVQVFYKLYSLNENKYINFYILANKLLDFIISIDINLDLAEQYDPVNNIQLSAHKLTWNYSELYFSIKN